MTKKLFLFGLFISLHLSADAQLIYPWRDMIRALAGNTIPPATTSKKGYAMITDTAGVWRYHKLETYIEDSLDISGGGGEPDGDWLKYPESPDPPEWGDSMVTINYTLFDGLSGGIQTKIEMLQNGVFQFDHGTGLTSRLLSKYTPLQKGEGNTDFNTSLSTFSTAHSRNNDVFSMGWNLGANGAQEVAGGRAWGLSFANYRVQGSEVYKDFFLNYVDSAGLAYRPWSLSVNQADSTAWLSAYYVSRFDMRYPGDHDPWWQITRSGATVSNKIRDPTSNNGVEWYLDRSSNQFHLLNLGMTNPIFYTSNMYGLVANRLYMTTPGDTPNTIVGRNTGSNQFGTITPGNGLSLESGQLNVFPTLINDYYTTGDSLCMAYSYVIGGGFHIDTLCIHIDSISWPQDSTFISGDSICVIELGDTTCLVMGDVFDTHIGSTDLTLTGNRTLNLNGKTFQITSPSSGGGFYLTVNSVQSIARVQNLASGAILKNTALLELNNTASTGTERPAFQRFKNSNYSFSQGILHEQGAFVFSDTSNLYSPVWRYHPTGDTMSIMKRLSVYQNVGINIPANASYGIDLRGRIRMSNLANDGNVFINSGNGTATGTSNVCIGMSGASSITTGSSNIILGASGGSLSTGSNNILIGSFLAGGLGPSAKTQVIAIGSYSGHGSTAMDSSIYIGYRSAMTTSGGSSLEGVTIGNRAAESIAGAYRSVVIGTRAAFGGYNVVGTGAVRSVVLGYEVAKGQDLSGKLWIDNSDTIRPLIQGDFTNDTLRINGVLQVDGGVIVDEDGNPIGGGGGGGGSDDWGSQVVEIDSTLTGDGTSGSVLGVKKRRSRDVSTELELEIRDYYVNVTGGAVTDTIFLPEVATASIDWSGLASDQVGVGQTYVITNFRAAVPVVICAYNPAGSGSDDLLATQAQPGGSAGSAITINPGESVRVESIRYSSGVGYWIVK